MIATSFSSERGTSRRLSEKELVDFPRKGFLATRKVVLTVPGDSSSSNTSSNKDDPTNRSEARQLSVMIFFFPPFQWISFYYFYGSSHELLYAFIECLSEKISVDLHDIYAVFFVPKIFPIIGR